MNVDSLLFDLEMANRRLPAEPSDSEEIDSNELDEWKSIRSHLPVLIQLVREVKNGKKVD
jgi:hypothetical protein